MATDSGLASTDSTDHSRMRAKPWSGARGSSGLGPNHGKITGTPPRIARPAAKALRGLVKSTGGDEPAGNA